MKQYLDAVKEALEHGTRKPNRTGVDTISTFNINYEIDLRHGFPLLTTKKISWKNIVVENLWFLSGDTHIDLLRKHGCRFWDPWADENGKVPSAYGHFWRQYPVHDAEGRAAFNDQVAYAVDTLKKNPMSRRMVVLAWAPGNAQTSQLPPCHAMFVLNVQMDEGGSPMLCLHLTQRSADIALGVPYNIAGYSLLVHLFAQFADIKPGIFAHTLIDAHIYTAKADGSMAEYDHIPGLKEQLTRTPRSLPTLKLSPKLRGLEDIKPLLELETDALMEHFVLEGYDPHPTIKFKVAV